MKEAISIGLLGICLMTLGGCYFPGRTFDSTYLQSRDWAYGTPPKEQPPLYCYGSLGSRDCYAEPLSNREDIGEDKVDDTLSVQPISTSAPDRPIVILPH